MRPFTCALILTVVLPLIVPAPAPAQFPLETPGVRDLYWRYFSREPTPSEAIHWRGLLRGGMSPEEVQFSFLANDEYFNRYRRDPASFVAGLYGEVLNRRPARDEVGRWLNRFAQLRWDRARLVREFLQAAQVELQQRSPFGPSPNFPNPFLG